MRHMMTQSLSCAAGSLAQRTVLPVFSRFMLLGSVQCTAHQAMHSAWNCLQISHPLVYCVYYFQALSILPNLKRVYSQHSETVQPSGAFRRSYRSISFRSLHMAPYEMRKNNTEWYWREVYVEIKYSAWKFVNIYTLTKHDLTYVLLAVIEAHTVCT